jgi:hypothetical protein
MASNEGAIPVDAIEVTHISPDGAAERVDSGVDDITFPEPSDGFKAVAQSSLLNSAQLTSLYSTTGTRCHLVMCFAMEPYCLPWSHIETGDARD